MAAETIGHNVPVRAVMKSVLELSLLFSYYPHTHSRCGGVCSQNCRCRPCSGNHIVDASITAPAPHGYPCEVVGVVKLSAY